MSEKTWQEIRDEKTLEYWHSFKCTSIESNKEIKNLIFSAFTQGFYSGYKHARQETLREMQSIMGAAKNIKLIFDGDLPIISGLAKLNESLAIFEKIKGRENE